MRELEAMSMYVQVVEAQSFSGAARALQTTQPTVSRRIAELESYLGVTLLTRTTRQVRPTDVGLRYYEACLQALAAVESAREVAGQSSRSLRGRLRLTAPVSLSNAWLAPVLGDFLTTHPELRVELSLTEQHLDFLAEGMDIGIRVGGPTSSELQGRRLRSIRRLLLASPDWVKEHGQPTHPKQLQHARGLRFDRLRAWTLNNGEEQHSLSTDSITMVSNGDFLCALAKQGLGIAVLPEWVYKEPLQSGELVDLLPGWTADPIDLWIVWTKRLYLTAATRAFIDWFVTHTKETKERTPIADSES